MEIKRFKPIECTKEALDLLKLNSITNKDWQYASSGKAALFHCLKSLGVTGNILVPNYICNSILTPIYKIGLKPIFYDISLIDLNACIDDIEKKNKIYAPSCVLVASMYGTPANLNQIEQVCKANNVLLIDDAAQSFGAKTLQDKFVGTYGNAGFFSFSPGKPTSGHLGAFFWTENTAYTIDRKKHCFVHYLRYLDFYFNRYQIYKFEKYKIFKLFSFFYFFLQRITDLTNDNICDFEKNILGGVLYANSTQSFRNTFFSKYLPKLTETNLFTVITQGNYNSNNHKFVLLFKTENTALHFRKELNRKNIYASNGYKLLSDSADTPNGKNIENRVIEIPIEEDEQKMSYIISSINSIIEEFKI